MDRNNAKFFGGIALALFAAALMVWTEATVAVPITLLIVGISLIATSNENTPTTRH